MNKIISKIKDNFSLTTLLLAILIGFLLFMWFEVRPSIIISQCSQKSPLERSYEVYQAYYKKCLNDNGIKF